MINPIIRKEAHTALRTWRSYLLIALYTLMMLAILAVSLRTMRGDLLVPALESIDPQSILMVFAITSACQIGLIATIVAGISASAISGERERQTLDLLLVTQLSPIRIVLGKLGSALGMGMLILFASMPVFGIYMYFGTISITMLFIYSAYTLLVALFYGAAGLLFSSIAKKTAVSVILTFVFIIFTTFGILIISIYKYSIVSEQSMLFMNLLNPIAGFMSITEALFSDTNLDMYLTSYEIPFWVVHVICSAASSLLMIYLSACRLSSVKKQQLLWK